jgi:hypothetical protein
MTNMQRRFFGLVAGLVALSGCGTTDAPTGLSSGPQGRVRFVNLITDPARVPVNVILENVPFGVNLAYTAATPPTLPAPSTALYSAVLAGSRTIVVKRTADTTVTLATIPLTVAENTDYTVFATGGTGGGTVNSFTTTDVNTVPAATETRWRVVNMSTTTGSVDVFLTATGADLTGATPDATGVAVQGNAYFTKAPGTYQIRMVPAGTAPAARNGAVVITIAAAAYTGGTGRTIVAADNAAGAGAARGFVLSDR